MAKFNSKTFNPQAFGIYVNKIPQLNKNGLIKSKALRGNSEIRNAFQTSPEQLMQYFQCLVF